jgi:hypothetical protein
VAAAGATAQTICPAGTSSNAGATSCLIAAPGYYFSGGNSPIQASAGYYARGSTTISGTSGYGATSQTVCPVNSDSAAGASVCVGRPGYTSNSDGTTFTSSANCSSASGAGMNWAGCTKTNTVFGNINISGAAFTNTNLSGSDFSGTYMGGNGSVSFYGANLAGAKFTGSTITMAVDLRGANLTGATNSNSGGLFYNANGVLVSTQTKWVSGNFCTGTTISTCQ